MTISKTIKTFFSMFIILISAMFYSELATAMPAPAEYHATAPANQGFMFVAIATPLATGVMLLAVCSQISSKAKHYAKIKSPETLYCRNKTTGGDGDEEEITTFGGGAEFRQIS